MAKIILQVQHILPASGWLFGTPYLKTKPISDYDPVVVFVQVLVIDTDYISIGPELKVLPLGIDYYQDLSELVGTDIAKLNQEIFFHTQFEAPDDD